MATRQVLADLVAGFAQQSGTQAAIESVGGVDAAKRVAAGEAFDVVILASDAIDKLLAAGHLVPGSKVDWVHSGVPVGSLVAKGEVALGFQQLSELLHVQGIQIAGPLPPAIQITTTFSAGVGVHSQQVDAARSLLAYLASPAAAEAKQKQGMESA